MINTSMMKNKAALPSLVWWDFNNCPIPDGYDACQVRPCIESALEKFGCSDPLTLTVIGNLKHTPVHVLRALSSTGIALNNGSRGGVSTFLLCWTSSHPPPANIMFISGSRQIEIFSGALSWLQTRGFNIFLAYSDAPPKPASPLVTCAEWLWKSLLEDEMETSRHFLLQDKCSETGESAHFSCTICFDHKINKYFACQSLEDFTTHLKGEEHQLSEFDRTTRDLTKDKDYMEEMARVERSERMLKNKLAKARVYSSHLMNFTATTVIKKLSKRKKRRRRRIRDTFEQEEEEDRELFFKEEEEENMAHGLFPHKTLLRIQENHSKH